MNSFCSGARILSVAMLVLGLAACQGGESPGSIDAWDVAGADNGAEHPTELAGDADDRDGEEDADLAPADTIGDAAGEVPAELPDGDVPAEVAPQCQVDMDCDDGNACTRDRCIVGTCVQSRVQCDDFDPCTIDVCDPVKGCATRPVAGCVPYVCTRDDQCDDNDPCSYDSCNLSTATCLRVALACDDGDPCTIDSCTAGVGCQHWPNGTCGKCTADDDCDDGDVCTDDSCLDGACTQVLSPCNDGNPCTLDRCDPITGCKAVPMPGCGECTSDSDCDDGDVCTRNDRCDDGTCAHDAVECDDANPCTVDFCTRGASGPYCTYRPTEGVACDDGNACTTDDTCTNKLCVGTAVTCNDGDPCTSDYCDAGKGCVFSPLPNCAGCTSDAGCNDDNACTKDTCAGGLCQNTALPCDDGDPCTTDGCDPASGCTHVEIANCGTPCAQDADCDDADVCTRDKCTDNVCVNTVIVCDDANPCTTDKCTRGPGYPYCTYAAIADGTACDDRNACTTGDTCVAKACVGKARSCDDDDECTADSCDAATGQCRHQPIAGCGPCTVDADCDDSDVCTRDKCSAGTCVNTVIVCDDANPCTTDKCTRGPGYPYCSYFAIGDGTACDDGSACTTGDSCTGKTCGGTALDCDDNDPCTSDSCAPATGCVNTPIPGCTGTCKSAADCDDGNARTCDCCCTLSGGTAQCYNVEPPTGTCPACSLIPGCS